MKETESRLRHEDADTRVNRTEGEDVVKRRVFLFSIVTIVLVAVFTIALPLSALAALPTDATVTFGRDLGSSNPHAMSDHASNFIFPRTTVISVNGTVSFVVNDPHEAYIFVAGLNPTDVVVSENGTIDEEANEDNILKEGEEGEDYSYTFTEPGRYLILCGFSDHFSEDNMWGWVIVK